MHPYFLKRNRPLPSYLVPLFENEGLNGVNRLATKAEKYYTLPTKQGKNNRLAANKLTEIYCQPTKMENVNRQPKKK